MPLAFVYLTNFTILFKVGESSDYFRIEDEATAELTAQTSNDLDHHSVSSFNSNFNKRRLLRATEIQEVLEVA